MIKLDIEKGDTILVGKFRNRKVVVKEIGIDEHGLPTVNGKGIMKIRIEKLETKKKLKESDMDIKKIIREELARIKEGKEFISGIRFNGVYSEELNDKINYAMDDEAFNDIITLEGAEWKTKKEFRVVFWDPSASDNSKQDIAKLAKLIEKRTGLKYIGTF